MGKFERSALIILVALVVVAILVVINTQSNTPQVTTPTTSTPPASLTMSGWFSKQGIEKKINRFLKENLRDPSSVEYIDNQAVTTPDGTGYMVKWMFRAKNGFGGYNREEWVFYFMASGALIGVLDNTNARVLYGTLEAMESMMKGGK